MEQNNRRVTKEQKCCLICYLEEHREFAHDRFTNDSGVKSLAEQWSSLALTLNSLCGALKDCEGWKRAWINMRSKAKQKAQDLCNAMARSGVNSVEQNALTDLDKRIIGLMTKEAVIGNLQVGEPLAKSFRCYCGNKYIARECWLSI